MSDKMSKDLIQSYLNTALRQLEIDVAGHNIDCEISVIVNSYTFGKMDSPIILGALNSDTMKLVYFYAVAFENPPPDQGSFELEFSGPVELVVQDDDAMFKQSSSFYKWGYSHTFWYGAINMLTTVKSSIAKELSYHLK